MALIEASRLLLAYGIDYAARVQNGYVSPGTGGHARPPQELENGPVSSENVPASARASPTCRPLVMKGSPVRVPGRREGAGADENQVRARRHQNRTDVGPRSRGAFRSRA